MVIYQLVEQRIGLPPVLSRAEMREGLLALPGGVSNMVYKVGSDPSDPRVAFQDIVRPEILKSGYAAWVQSPPAKAGGMNEQLYYHPDLGLDWDGSRILLLPGYEEQLVAALEDPAGIDLHPEAAPGWQIFLTRASELASRIAVVKTHIATPSCSENVLNEEVIPWQADIYRALMRGHLKNARTISPRIIVSADDPNPFDREKFMANFEVMFGDRFEDGKLIEQGAEVLRAIHCCGQGDFLGAMSTGAVDVVHWDALKYPGVLLGRSDVLGQYLANGGMFAWGGAPQTLETMLDLAVELGFDKSGIVIRSPKSFIPVVEFLKNNFHAAVYSVYDRYTKWLWQIERESEIASKQIAGQTFISATCGYGANPVPELRRVSYDIARLVGDLNYKLAS